jgi:hypothetical protein
MTDSKMEGKGDWIVTDNNTHIKISSITSVKMDVLSNNTDVKFTIVTESGNDSVGEYSAIANEFSTTTNNTFTVTYNNHEKIFKFLIKLGNMELGEQYSKAFPTNESSQRFHS